MCRLTLTAVGLLVAVASPAAEPEPRSPKDVFGHPRPHGEPVKGAFVGLYTGRTNLFFGQPMLVELFAVPVTEAGPYVNPDVDYEPNVRIELTDAAGKPVPFRLESGQYQGGPNGESYLLRLRPTEVHAVGPHWKPGAYHLRAVVEKPDDPTHPNSLPGTFRSNRLDLNVAAPGAALDTLELDAGARDRAARLVRQLDAPAPADRKTAEQALGRDFGPGVLRLLDATLDDASPRVRRHLGAAIRGWEERLTAAAGPFGSPAADAFWLWAGGLDERSSEWLRARANVEINIWKTNAARFAPVTVPQDRPLKPGEAAALIRSLRHVDPWARMLAVRSVPRGASIRVLAALAKRLADPYEEWPPFIGGEPAPLHPVRLEARAAAARLGRPMVEPLLAFAGTNAGYEQDVAEVLGKIGPDPKARDFLRELIRGGGFDDQYAAQKAAAAWGKEGAELLRELVAAPGLHVNIRRDAIEALGRHGDPAVDGPTVHKLLAEKEWNVQWAAVKAVGSLRYKEALPDLERIARDPAVDQNTRYAAVDGVLALVDEKAGNRLLLDLTDSKHGKAVRSFAFTRIGQRKVTAALPTLLDALTDPDRHTRTAADDGLRGLAGLREGVGYDPQHPNPKKWREYWARKK